MHEDPLEPGSWRLSRRTFVQGSLCSLALLALPCPVLASLDQGIKQGFITPRPALFFQTLPGNQVKCLLCPRGCEVLEGNRGTCGVRENRGGKYYTLVYGNPCAVHMDPVEKKPFFHALPGALTFSFGMLGCNFKCAFSMLLSVHISKIKLKIFFDWFIFVNKWFYCDVIG